MTAVTFGSETTILEGGGRGAVAVNNAGQVVVIMLSDTCLQYVVGTADANAQTVSFPSSPQPAYTWDKGDAVCDFDVAMAPTANQVVLVFEQGGGKAEMFYRVGTISGNSISWEPAVQFDTGAHPSVTMSDTHVVEVHTSQNNTAKLYYHVGAVDGGSVDGFNQGGTEFVNVGNPVFGVSTSINTYDWLLTTVAWRPGSTIDGSVNYYGNGVGGSTFMSGLNDGTVTTGTWTSVVLYPSGLALEVHNGNLDTAVAYMTGSYNETSGDENAGTVTWDPQVTTDFAGTSPDIAACGQYAVLTYVSADTNLSTMARFVAVG